MLRTKKRETETMKQRSGDRSNFAQSRSTTNLLPIPAKKWIPADPSGLETTTAIVTTMTTALARPTIRHRPSPRKNHSGRTTKPHKRSFFDAPSPLTNQQQHWMNHRQRKPRSQRTIIPDSNDASNCRCSCCCASHRGRKRSWTTMKSSCHLAIKCFPKRTTTEAKPSNRSQSPFSENPEMQETSESLVQHLLYVNPSSSFASSSSLSFSSSLRGKDDLWWLTKNRLAWCMVNGRESCRAAHIKNRDRRRRRRRRRRRHDYNILQT